MSSQIKWNLEVDENVVILGYLDSDFENDPGFYNLLYKYLSTDLQLI